VSSQYALSVNRRPTGEHSLITGGAGFIGANVADALIGGGATVTLFDNLSRPGSSVNLDWLRERHGDTFRFIDGDVRDADAVSSAMQDVQVAYHLAGQTAVTFSVEDPRFDLDANLVGTINVLEAARAARERPIVIYASTNKVYGSLERLPVVEDETRYRLLDPEDGISEEQPLDFYSPYGCSKGAADQYVRDYHRIYGVPTIVFRQSCIYGPRQMGSEDQGWVGWFLIATLLEEPIVIAGDGKQVRDLLYIDELVDAYQLAVDHIEYTAGQVYNIGGGRARTLSVWQEFARLAEQILGRRLEVSGYVPARPGDQRIFYCDTSKALRDFGWQPRVGVEEGIRRLAEWVESELPNLRARRAPADDISEVGEALL
jgi:CDP-paratose 2-epimerase